jgi:tetratricopeptide (TPR) repeat protein/DNA-binding SARP family transcriptional activator
VYSHLTHLRRILDTVNGAEDRIVPAMLSRQSGGYVLRLHDDEVDLHRMRRLAAAAQGLGCPPAERIGQLRDACALWRGPALAGLSGDWAGRMREAWEHERMDALVAWADAEVQVDNPAPVLGPLTELVAEHPMAEPLVAVLMRALSAAGRPADALELYASIRELLATELGAEPTPALQAVHMAILQGDLSVPSVAVGDRIRSVPAQLPADVSNFTGRDAELTQLDSLMAGMDAVESQNDDGRPASTEVVISAVAGTAGVGKTALALRWAHRSRGRFPDGQLYLDLRGYDPDRPMSAADALARLLDGLGVPTRLIPRSVDDRAARYRTEAAGKRMLVLLDNAAGVEQVRPLLPGIGPSAVLVTSRASLSGLVAVHGAHRIDLDLLTLTDAITLLRRLIGPRVDAEPAAAGALAEQCARLPLALRVAAELAVSRPATPLSDLVTELADRQSRLDRLDSGDDPRAAVTTVFSWSLQDLPAEATRTFALLGMCPGTDLDAYAAATLTTTSSAEARRTLDLLARANLVAPTRPGRYGMHDLLRAYAAQLATEEDARLALTRLFDYYLAACAAAMDYLHPAETHTRPKVPPSATPKLRDADGARTWLDTERPMLVAIAAHTATHGWQAHTIQLSALLFRYLDGGHYSDAIAIHSDARRAALDTGDDVAEARALTNLAAAQRMMGSYEEAAEYLRRAIGLLEGAPDPAGLARALLNLGNVRGSMGRYTAAVEHFQRAIPFYRLARDEPGEASAVVNLATVEGRLGHYRSAVEHFRQSLAIYRRHGARPGVARALNNVATVERRLGEHSMAIDHIHQALILYRQLGHRSGEAQALDNLGSAYLSLGEFERAAQYHRQALTLFREAGERDDEPWALNGLGEANHATGRTADALVHHTEALTIARATGARDQQARAHAGLGDAHHALGNHTQAREHYNHAVSLYIGLSSPEATQLRARLAALDQRTEPRRGVASAPR